LGEARTIAQSLSDEEATVVADAFYYDLTIIDPNEEVEIEEEEAVDEAALRPRPPVITVMGHVDHGKTLLLDKIRQTDVVAQEHGGITQHIGAYQVHKAERAITFIDTPGHEAFTQMRARGASVTDIAVLVVAADDGVKPQTVEAMNHAKAAGVPIVVAVNKIDKPEADPTRVRQQLTEHTLIPEEWGGETPFVDISAKANQNIDGLLDLLLLVADIQELKANPELSARGVVIEAHLDKGRGPVATVLVQRGTLRVGDIVVCGTAIAKVRAMLDDTGAQMKEAGPGTPTQVQGFDEVPQAGDEFRQVADERKARQIAQQRMTKRRAAELVSGRRRVSLEDVFATATAEGDVIELNIVLKADVQGSLEAVTDALEKMQVENAVVRVLHRAVGAITENDITLAEASGAIVLGFNVRPTPAARALAEADSVDVRTYQIIYKLVEDVEAALKGMLRPIFEEVVLGRAEVRQVFKGSKIGTIAGCFVEEGTIGRNAKVRLLRDGVIIADSTISSLKRFKDDAREVQAGFECGIGIENYQDLKDGDSLEAYEIREIART
jgi:translation initiation factor IF-2